MQPLPDPPPFHSRLLLEELRRHLQEGRGNSTTRGGPEGAAMGPFKFGLLLESPLVLGRFAGVPARAPNRLKLWSEGVKLNCGLTTSKLDCSLSGNLQSAV